MKPRRHQDIPMKQHNSIHHHMVHQVHTTLLHQVLIYSSSVPYGIENSELFLAYSEIPQPYSPRGPPYPKIGQYAYQSHPYAAFSPYTHPMHIHNQYAGQPPVQPYAVPTVAPQQPDAQETSGNYYR